MDLGTQRIIQINTTGNILMKQYIHIDCPSCQRDDLVKNGHRENGAQRDRGHSCKRSLQWEYTSPAWLPGTKAHIEIQTLNGSGVRDISRNLGMAKNTVIAELKTHTFRDQRAIRRTPEGDAVDHARRGDLRGSGCVLELCGRQIQPTVDVVCA